MFHLDAVELLTLHFVKELEVPYEEKIDFIKNNNNFDSFSILNDKHLININFLV